MRSPGDIPPDIWSDAKRLVVPVIVSVSVIVGSATALSLDYISYEFAHWCFLAGFSITIVAGVILGTQAVIQSIKELLEHRKD